MTDDIYHSDFQLGPDLKGKRIVVAMSGGVDSSVVAALAARTGAETIGVTLQLYDHGSAVKRAGACCAGQDIRDARAVADKLGIAHYVFDHESRFRESVIDHFADEYMAGRTPIPCVRWATRPNCQPLTLSHLEFDGGPTVSMPAAARPHCILAARNSETLTIFSNFEFQKCKYNNSSIPNRLTKKAKLLFF